jgi:hypothetical protein
MVITASSVLLQGYRFIKGKTSALVKAGKPMLRKTLLVIPERCGNAPMKKLPAHPGKGCVRECSA